MRVLIGGVGYRNLRDHSAGLEVADRLMAQPLRDGVVIEDLSYNPIAVAQRLQDEPVERQFGRAIFVSAIARSAGRAPGTVAAYRWDRVLPAGEEIHRAICDAVTGIIHLDNTLIVLEHLRALPPDVCVLEIEPLVHEFGEAFSSAVHEAVERACATVARIAVDDAFAGSLPVGPPGGAAVGARTW